MKKKFRLVIDMVVDLQGTDPETVRSRMIEEGSNPAMHMDFVNGTTAVVETANTSCHVYER
jgi:hypothetical protein